ncbi:MAG: phasin family protein [Micavibrio sp.]|nr:phasin family protein [Micavibrio sp.]
MSKTKNTTTAKKAPAANAASKTVKKAAKKTTPKASTKVATKGLKKTSPKKKKSVAVKAGKKPGVQTTTTFSQKGSKASVNQKASAQISDVTNYFKQMETFMPQTNIKFDQIAQDAANSSREGVEAFIKSGTIFAKGFESWFKTAASLSQSAAEKQAQYAKELMSSKTLNEAAEKQNKIAQANFEEFVGNASKLSEMGVKLINDSIEPINSQMSKTMSKAKKAA